MSKKYLSIGVAMMSVAILVTYSSFAFAQGVNLDQYLKQSKNDKVAAATQSTKVKVTQYNSGHYYQAIQYPNNNNNSRTLDAYLRAQKALKAMPVVQTQTTTAPVISLNNAYFINYANSGVKPQTPTVQSNYGNGAMTLTQYMNIHGKNAKK